MTGQIKYPVMTEENFGGYCGFCERSWIGTAHSCYVTVPALEDATIPIPVAITYGPDTPPVVTRDRVKPLEAALKAISADRNATHGEPKDSFGAIAAFWKVYDQFNKGQNGEAHDVAMRQLLLKVARICVGSPANLDSYTDAAGYAGCAYELAVQHSKRMKES